MQFTNLTRKNEIGANCYYLEINGRGYLLDCGSHPKIEGSGGLPTLDFLKGKPLRSVLVSHGHLDHLGSLPVVLEAHPDARAYLTLATCMIADRALHNSTNVMIKQRDELHLPEYPLFTHRQVDRLVEDFEAASYERPFDTDGAEITYYEAGHVLGAAGIWVQAGNQSLFYTGDVKFSDMKITRGAKFPNKKPDVMVIECTRGNTPTRPDATWDCEVERLSAAIQETYDRGGSVLIPCFALGKMQEMLKLFYDLMQSGKMARQPIYISGLGRSYNEIYDDLANRHPRVCPGFKITKSLDLHVLDPKEGLTMKLGRGRLMLVSSGMMTPHTMSHRMTQRMACDERHSIFFVGYADPDSPAGKIKAAGRGGSVNMGGSAGEFPLKCRIESFDFTSHCNRENMLEYVTRIQPSKILLVHGETPALEWFRSQLQLKLPDSRIFVPPSGETLNLSD